MDLQPSTLMFEVDISEKHATRQAAVPTAITWSEQGKSMQKPSKRLRKACGPCKMEAKRTKMHEMKVEDVVSKAPKVPKQPGGAASPKRCTMQVSPPMQAGAPLGMSTSQATAEVRPVW